MVRSTTFGSPTVSGISGPSLGDFGKSVVKNSISDLGGAGGVAPPATSSPTAPRRQTSATPSAQPSPGSSTTTQSSISRPSTTPSRPR